MPRPNRNTDAWFSLAVSVGAAAVATGLYYAMTQVRVGDELRHRYLPWIFSPWVVAFFFPLGLWYAAVVASTVRHSRSHPGWWRLAPVLLWAAPWCFWADTATRLGLGLHVGLARIGVYIESVDRTGLAGAHDVHVAMGVVISGFVTAALTWWATGSRLVLVTLLAVAPLGAVLFRFPGSDYAALATWWVAAVASLTMWARQRRFTARDGLCVRCGYDLRGLPRKGDAPLICPECGRADGAKAV